MLLIKTTAAARPSLKRRIAKLHAYDAPERFAFDAVDGLATDLACVDAEASAR